MLLSPLHVDRLSEAQNGIGWRPRHIRTDFWLSILSARYSPLPRRNVWSRFGRGVCQEGRPVRYTHVPRLPPCGDSPRLHSRLEAAASEEAYLARRRFCRLGLEGKALELPRTSEVAIVSATLPATPRMIPLESWSAQFPGTNGGSSDLAFANSAGPPQKWRNRRLRLNVLTSRPSSARPGGAATRQRNRNLIMLTSMAMN